MHFHKEDLGNRWAVFSGVSSETFGNLEGWGWELTVELLTHHGGGKSLRKSSQLAQEDSFFFFFLVKSKNVSYLGVT